MKTLTLYIARLIALSILIALFLFNINLWQAKKHIKSHQHAQECYKGTYYSKSDPHPIQPLEGDNE